jgi:hypothetical protein
MNSKLNTAAIAWLKNTEWELAITVTFRTGCSERRARKTMSRWLNELDKKFYGYGVRKENKRFERVVVRHMGSQKDHPHYHIAAKRPKNKEISKRKFLALAKFNWKKLSSAGYKNTFTEVYDSEGWLGYILRKMEKDNIDIMDEGLTYLIEQ